VREVHLRLYITGTSARSSLARKRVEDYCARLPEGVVKLEVFDLMAAGELAERDRIIATPTLRRLLPLPSVSLVGDMGNEEQLAALIDYGESPGRMM